jgi:hypothetical protein
MVDPAMGHICHFTECKGGQCANESTNSAMC